MIRATANKPIADMNAREVVDFVRNLPTPRGSQRHNIVDIASIAGASKAWVGTIQRTGKEPKANRRTEEFVRRLKQYAETILAQGKTMSSRDAVLKEQRSLLDKHAILEREVPVPDLRLEESDEAPEPDLTTEAKMSSVEFLSRMERLKASMWGISEEVDALFEAAPKMFKGGIGEFRTKFIELLEQLEG